MGALIRFQRATGFARPMSKCAWAATISTTPATFTAGYYTGSRFDGTWPLDDNYPNLRDALWLATDRAYKTALESMARKRAALNSANAPTEKLADFSQAEPVKSVAKVQPQEDRRAAWTARMVKLSAVFNAYPEVLASAVSYQQIEGATYLLNNEGHRAALSRQRRGYRARRRKGRRRTECCCATSRPSSRPARISFPPKPR